MWNGPFGHSESLKTAKSFAYVYVRGLRRLTGVDTLLCSPWPKNVVIFLHNKGQYYHMVHLVVKNERMRGYAWCIWLRLEQLP